MDQATKDQPLAEQQAVTGGMSPYAISGEVFEVTDSAGTVMKGSGIGPGLQLVSRADRVWVLGTPSIAGTYNFTFIVNDARGKTSSRFSTKWLLAEV